MEHPPVAGAASLVSVNVGLPTSMEWQGKSVRTAIFKAPVAGAVHVGATNLAGDLQGDPSVHGGPFKAVYLYPSEHYAFWRADLGALGWGAFGENLTTAGLSEATTRIGDRLRVGTAELVVTQPRLPCFKLELRFGRPGLERRFLRSGRTGFYLSVAAEGEVRAGEPIVVEPEADSVTIAEVVGLYRTDRPDRELLRKLAGLPALPEALRLKYGRKLKEVSPEAALPD